jgi:UDP-N-acetylglucosamine--N-acetylmuramyl-(pentapeptide) pyrophosphoryl-undecaprenol N-acetylglucosamine transferase
VLIFGGSLGAARINAAAVSLLERWRDRDDVQIILIAGDVHANEIAARVPQGKLTVWHGAFVERMELAYAAADIVVSRSGASTVAELAVVGVPAVLIPFPHALRKEQHANARAMQEVGAARLVDDTEVTGEILAGLLEELLHDSAMREKMSSAARASARPHAADEMAQWITELAENRRG